MRQLIPTLRWRFLTIAALLVLSIIALIPRNVRQRSFDAATGQMRDTTVRRVPISLGLDLRGGIQLALEPDPSKATVTDCVDAIRRAERVVRTRLDEFGTAEPLVQVAGRCRLIVELPGMSDPARAKSVVQRTAFLEFRITDTREQFLRALPGIDAALRREGTAGSAAAPPSVTSLLSTNAQVQSSPGNDSASGVLSTLLTRGALPGEFFVREADAARVESLIASDVVQRLMPLGIELKWGAVPIPGTGESSRTLYALNARAIVTGMDLIGAMAAQDEITRRIEVRFNLSRDAGRVFSEATQRNIGNHLAILLDGRVQGQPPTITERIAANGRILMPGKTLMEASDLALVLRAGSLPVPLKVVEEHAIGPSLGHDSISAGVRASILAVAFVVLVMGVYYRFSGMLAVAALATYVAFSLGGLAALGYTLTLPGLAGFALAIGMAVDANVLIFERIREEQAGGTPVQRAVNVGFKNAMGAIVDSNVTTAITAWILYMVGTDSVRGFAVTLLIGLGASMLSAIFVTRTLFMLWLERRPAMSRVRFLSFPLFERAAFDFIKVRRWAYGLSLAVIVPGLILLAARGVSYSIEFTGGALTQIHTQEPVGTAALRNALDRGGLLGAEPQTFGSDRDYVIRARLNAQTSASDTTAITTAVTKALDAGIGAGQYQVVRSEGVGPKVGAELQRKALIAILFSFAATLVYLAFRFEWRFGVAAVVATAHDILATVAFIRYADLEVSLVVVAGLLTVLGYSLNDTIVIFDRVRENFRNAKGKSLVSVLNQSINETLPRTILTGGTTIATALFLSFFAGEVIKPFALVMSFGIIVGTFSSIFVASPILLWIESRWGKAGAHKREGLQEPSYIPRNATRHTV